MITMYPHVVLIPPTLISFYSNVRGRMMMLREHFSRLSMYWSICVILKALPRKDCVRNNTEHTYDIVSEFVGGSSWGVLDWPVSFACAAIKCCNNYVRSLPILLLQPNWYSENCPFILTWMTGTHRWSMSSAKSAQIFSRKKKISKDEIG